MTITEVFRKPYDVETLQAENSAEGVNQNFDAIYLALQSLKDEVNELASSTTTTTTTTTGADEAFALMLSGV